MYHNTKYSFCALKKVLLGFLKLTILNFIGTPLYYSHLLIVCLFDWSCICNFYKILEAHWLIDYTGEASTGRNDC